MLQRAMAAPSPRSRALWARRGLAQRGPLDRTTQAMLLRQLYLAYFETRRFDKAIVTSEQLVATGVLSDVAHQDAARAKQAAGDIEGAAGHLRLAARTGPASRRAFHWWTLGSLYYLARRYDEAIGALTRAARWGTRDKPLYQGHLAVVQCESGVKVQDLGVLIARLSEVPAGQGYGRFVLGQMAYFDRRWDEAKRHLESFVQRSTSGRAAVAIALDGEIEVARQTLAAIPKR
jgi:tetratricopeptide (TPR) repeat protein